MSLNPPLPPSILADLDQADTAGRLLIDNIVIHVREQLELGRTSPAVLALALGKAARDAGHSDLFTDIAGLALVRLAQLPPPPTDPRQETP